MDNIDENESKEIMRDVENKDVTNNIITSQSLKATTKIGGWLSFFLFIIVFGGLLSAILPILSFSQNEYAGSRLYAVIDVVFGIFLCAMSIYTLYAFVQRKPNAVFFAKTYLIIVFVYNILILALSYLDPETNRQSLRSTIWSVLWYIYLVESKQVKRVIPVSFRRLTIYDYLAVALCVLIPVCIGIAACVIDSGKDFNYSRSNALFMKNVKLREGEFTDSIIIFTSPKGFTTEKDTENATTFTVHDDGGATAIIYGDYFEGEFTDEDYAEYYSLFEEAPEEGETKTDISDKKYVVNNHDCHQRVAQYSIYGDDDATVFWRFVVMYDSETSKICIISSYDNGGTDYLNDLLLSVRFK